MSDVKNLSAGTACVCFMNYKIKLEHERHREYKSKFFGKHGMSWNFLVFSIRERIKRGWIKCVGGQKK